MKWHFCGLLAAVAAGGIVLGAPEIPRFSVSNMDKSVAPGADFFQFAAGSWIKHNPVPADKSSWGGFAELQERNWHLIREILESEDWLALPTKFDIHEWAIMDEFSCSVDDPELRNELRNAIRGAGAFRYFKDTIYRHELQESWYSYRTAVLDRIAIDWLDEHEIAHTRE